MAQKHTVQNKVNLDIIINLDINVRMIKIAFYIF